MIRLRRFLAVRVLYPLALGAERAADWLHAAAIWVSP